MVANNNLTLPSRVVQFAFDKIDVKNRLIEAVVYLVSENKTVVLKKNDDVNRWNDCVP
jgi:hypothetical protein